MKWFLIFFLFSGCAETRLYQHGQLVAVIQGDAVNVTIRTDTLYFHADTINHSIPTSAAYTGATKAIGGIGSAVTSAILAAP